MDTFQIVAKGDLADILIYGDIGDSGEGSVSASKFIRQLDSTKANDINVRINSFGGSVADGVAIYNALARRRGQVDVHIDGVAISAASLIAMAGKRTQMAKNAVMMIHGPMAVFAGTAQEHHDLAVGLSKTAEAMAQCYATKSKKPYAEMLALMNDGRDHWYSADEAKAAGFVDSVGPVSTVSASLDPSRFKDIPAFAAAFFKSSNDSRSRAASGAGESKRTIFLPGASGKPLETPKGKQMETVSGKLTELETKRGEMFARMQELATKANGDFASLEDDESAEHDRIAFTDLPKVDLDIKRWKAHEANVSGAAPVHAGNGNDGTAARQGRVTYGKTPPVEKGIAFAQFVKMLGRAKGNPMHAMAIAQQAKHIDPRVPKMLAAAVNSGVTDGSETAGDWGMQLVGTETGVVADFVEFLRPQTILGKFGTNGIPSLRRVPFRVPLVGMSDGGKGFWVGEGKAKPVTSFQFTRNHLLPLKVAAICVVTRELLADSSPAADGLLRDALAAALRERQDEDFIDPNNSGSTGVKPPSITNGVSLVASSGNTFDKVIADVQKVFKQFVKANNPPTQAVWIMSATNALALSMMLNPLGQRAFPGASMTGGTLEGIPIIASEYVHDTTAGSDVFLVNASDIYFADDGGITVDTSEHASIEMSDNPESDTGTVVNMYQTNRVAFRAERRLDWMLRRPSAVSGISTVNWGEA